MHREQQAFLEAFKAWDGARMGDALVRMTECFAGGRRLSDATRTQLNWQCRELLQGMEAHPRLGSIVEVPEIDLQLVVSGEVEWTGDPGVAKHPRFKLHVRPGADQPPSVRERWREHGFTDQPILLDRDEVRTPAPLKDEPGHDAAASVAVHRPPNWRTIPEQHTYAYALSLEDATHKPRLQRYQAGDCERVWGELMSMGDGVRDPAVLGDAVAVARETMRRCRMNVEGLVDYLRRKGYAFRNEELAHVPPDFDVRAKIADLERQAGPLPLSLCAWYEIVGSVDLTGRFEGDWAEYPDPLLMLPAGFVLNYDDNNWRRERYVIALSPDYYHKEYTSGGPPYSMGLPTAAIDAPFQAEWHRSMFVSYLRTCFQWGGMPGLGLRKGVFRQDHPYVRDVSKALLPI